MHLRKHFYENAQNGIRTLQKQNIKICAKHGTERNEIGEFIKNYNHLERYRLVKEDLKNEKRKVSETVGVNEEKNDGNYGFANKLEINEKEVLTKKVGRDHKILYDYNTKCSNIYGKRNYSHGNANFLKNTAGRNSTVRDKMELSGDNRNEIIRRDNEQNRNFYILQKNQKSYLANENATNMYINKLHDYLNLAHRSESDKIKINKILMKLKSENLTAVSILHILKDLCNFFLKKSSKHLEEPVAFNYMENKNALKKVKNYLEEYFVYIENYLRDYSTFINEENMLDLFKYLYYLNYSLSRNTMELLLERFYLCIDKMDNLKAVQIYYIAQSFYKHCYFQKPDYYLSLVVDEKLKAWFSQKPYAFSFDLNTQKYLLNSYKNSYWDQKKGSVEIATPMFSSTFVENRMNIKPVDKKTNNEFYEISEESKELMQIFKYIQNFHDNMNFFYHYNVMHFIEKDMDHFSLNELLIIFEIYNNDRYDVFTAKIVNRLIQRVEQMDENNLVLLSKHLKRFKNKTHSLSANSVGENDTQATSNYSVLLTVVDKIVEIIHKDKDFFLPDNTASILLNINTIMQTIVNKVHLFKKEDKREENGLKDTTAEDTQLTNKDETQSTNGNELQRKIQREMIAFCDEHINNVHSFDTILSLYLFYIKNESIKSKTIQIFEQKLKTNKNKLRKQDISDIILSLSMFPFHTTKMLPYLENVINERLEESNDMYENEMNVEDLMKKTGTNELTFRENNINGAILNFQTNHLIDVSMSLGIIGRKNLKMWNYIDVDKVILTINKHLLLYLSYSFLLTNYWNTLSWYFIIKRIVEDVRVFKRKHYELLYEILKCSLLFNVIDLTNFTNNSFEHLSNTTTTNSFVKNAKRRGTNESNHHFVKNFNYLLNTSYNHYKLKLIKNQYISKVPYEEVFNYLKIAYEKNIEFKQLYLIPFLLKDYKIIIDPLPSTPIHKSSGFIMGEIQLKHKVFQFDKFTVLSFCDALWEKYIIVDAKGNRKYDIKALSEHFQTYIESHIKMETIKKSFNASTNIANSAAVNGTKKEEKYTNQVSYLKVKRRYAPPPASKKYLTNKGGVQDPNKYLKVKTKVGKR